jgi:hypothetical protein
MVYRKTIGKRMAAKLRKIRQPLRQGLHKKTNDTTEWWWQLRRRSQRTRWTWNKYWERLGSLLPEVEILHPYPR